MVQYLVSNVYANNICNLIQFITNFLNKRIWSWTNKSLCVPDIVKM